MILLFAHLCNIAILFLLNIKVPYLRPINLCTCFTVTPSVDSLSGSKLLILFICKFTCELKVLWLFNCERFTALERSADGATFSTGIAIIFA